MPIQVHGRRRWRWALHRHSPARWYSTPTTWRGIGTTGTRAPQRQQRRHRPHPHSSGHPPPSPTDHRRGWRCTVNSDPATDPRDRKQRNLAPLRRVQDNLGVGTFLVAGLIGCVSLLYATAGQAGGTAFLAIMAFAAF